METYLKQVRREVHKDVEFSISAAARVKFVKTISDALCKALETKDVLVKVTFDTQVEYDVAVMAMERWSKDLSHLALLIDWEKSTKDGDIIFEIRNGSALQFIKGWMR